MENDRTQQQVAGYGDGRDGNRQQQGDDVLRPSRRAKRRPDRQDQQPDRIPQWQSCAESIPDGDRVGR
ncbi:MAG: hypothetical protein Q8Q62_06900 [Mesorhizobium sp.]|nr:hypothetical protein [Mesorhizobium sp.]